VTSPDIGNGGAAAPWLDCVGISLSRERRRAAHSDH
jgi:hypothetical protein